jgi:hypothetical protein
MLVRNDLARFHLVQDVIDRVPKIGYMAAYVRQPVRDKLIEHQRHIRMHGEDMPEMCDWRWTSEWSSAGRGRQDVEKDGRARAGTSCVRSSDAHAPDFRATAQMCSRGFGGFWRPQSGKSPVGLFPLTERITDGVKDDMAPVCRRFNKEILDETECKGFGFGIWTGMGLGPLSSHMVDDHL